MGSADQISGQEQICWPPQTTAATATRLRLRWPGSGRQEMANYLRCKMVYVNIPRCLMNYFMGPTTLCLSPRPLSLHTQVHEVSLILIWTPFRTFVRRFSYSLAAAAACRGGVGGAATVSKHFQVRVWPSRSPPLPPPPFAALTAQDSGTRHSAFLVDLDELHIKHRQR